MAARFNLNIARQSNYSMPYVLNSVLYNLVYFQVEI